MIDQYGRDIHYLRLSVTERCTLRCAYCRSDEGICPKRTELSSESFVRIVRVMASLGVNKVRVTGGEPLLRRDLMALLRDIRGVAGIEELDLTTNAQQLCGQAKALKETGLDRMNISIDSLQEARYAELTGGGSLSLALRGIDEALDAGFTPLKLNIVLLRGVNDDEVNDFIALTRERPIDVRFIELMPFGNGGGGDRRVTGAEIRAARTQLIPVEKRYEGQPSDDYRMPGHAGRVCFIDAVSRCFCAGCNRIRVMSDGRLRPCLGQNAEVSLLAALAAPDDDELRDCVCRAIYEKPATHGFNEGFSSGRDMSQIGG